jgi:RNA polymerase sigma-70 factor (ECF subfamily)
MAFMQQNPQHTEKEIVAGCAANSRYYQELLYRKYFPVMMRMCMRYTEDRDVALEIINNGFLRVFQKIETFTFSGSLEGWIRRVVFHCLSDYFRQNTRKIDFLELEGRDAPTRSSALTDLYLEDLLSLVDRLPDQSQRVFRLYAIEGYTHAEIGEMLSMSEGTSKWYLSIARKELKEMINRQLTNQRNYAG